MIFFFKFPLLNSLRFNLDKFFNKYLKGKKNKREKKKVKKEWKK